MLFLAPACRPLPLVSHKVPKTTRIQPATRFQCRRLVSQLSALAPNRSLPLISQNRGSHRQLNARQLHLAPPFLLDQHTPRYQLLSSVDAAKKRSLAYAHLSQCNLCPRNCNVNRYEKLGVCNIGAETVKVATIAPHFGEEPCIQGHHGSGSVFFSSCNLRCVFCQNHDTAHTAKGFDLTPEQLAEWYIKLVQVGNVHNINLVTPEHVVPQVVLSILAARDMGLNVPIVYNTSAYDSLDSLKLLDGLVDIYLPDFKVWEPSTARRLLKAENYVESAKESIKEMQRQVGDLCFTPDGIARSGVLLRHLVMPGYQDEGKEIMQWLGSKDGLGKDVFVNIMEQYFPTANVGKPKRRDVKVQEPGTEMAQDQTVRYQDINRRVEEAEIKTVRQAAEAVGIWRFCDPPKHDGFNL